MENNETNQPRHRRPRYSLLQALINTILAAVGLLLVLAIVFMAAFAVCNALIPSGGFW